MAVDRAKCEGDAAERQDRLLRRATDTLRRTTTETHSLAGEEQLIPASVLYRGMHVGWPGESTLIGAAAAVSPVGAAPAVLRRPGRLGTAAAAGRLAAGPPSHRST
jgi:hypothetical protein